MASGKPDPGKTSGLSGTNFMDQLQAHYRDCKRKSVEIDAAIEFVDKSGTLIDKGTAIICNVSPTGALLAKVNVSKGAYPVDKFFIRVRMTSGPYTGIGFSSTPIRFVPEEGGIGVQFDEIFISQ